MANYLKLGDYNAICDVCGFEFKASQLKKRWDGVMVCSKDYETRHPQDLIRVPRESSVPPWVRPGPPDVFLGSEFIIQTERSKLDLLTLSSLEILLPLTVEQNDGDLVAEDGTDLLTESLLIIDTES